MTYYHNDRDNFKRDPYWKSTVYEFRNTVENFIEGTTMSLIRPMREFIREQRNNLVRKFSAIAVLTIGLIFLLLGVVKFINTYVGLGDWTGYLLVGIILFLTGVIMQRFD